MYCIVSMQPFHILHKILNVSRVLLRTRSHHLILTVIMITLSTLMEAISSKLTKPSELLLSSSSYSKQISDPKWINPCNLPIYSNEPIRESTVELEREAIYRVIHSRAGAAKMHTEKVKTLLQHQEGVKDPDFEDSLPSLIWLPNLGPLTKALLYNVEEETAFKKSFQYLQQFAIGFEQMILDQLLYEGTLLDELREVENYLFQLICELQLGMWILDISPDSHVQRKIMALEYREMKSASRRFIRDYAILKDYIRTVDYIGLLFSSLKSNHE